MQLIYVTCKDKKEAIKIGNYVVSEQLAACANIIDNVTSIYNWEGEIKNTTESTLLIKTANDTIDRIIEEIERIHSYDCPCIISLNVTKGNKEFIKWVENYCKVQ